MVTSESVEVRRSGSSLGSLAVFSPAGGLPAVVDLPDEGVPAGKGGGVPVSGAAGRASVEGADSRSAGGARASGDVAASRGQRSRGP